MAEYCVRFENRAEGVWTLVVFVVLTDSPGLQSVSWQQATAPENGASVLRWQPDLGAAIADYQQEGGEGVYSAFQVLPAFPGSVWDVLFLEEVQQLVLSGDTTYRSQVLIRNRSGFKANPGIALAGSGAVYRRNVDSGHDTVFVTSWLSYRAALFREVEQGEDVRKPGPEVGPVPINFPQGRTNATVTARLDNGQTVLKVVYGL